MNRQWLDYGRFMIMILLLLTYGATSLLAQEERNCDCTKVFDQMIQKLEANYIGLKHLSDEKFDKYTSRKEVYRSRVSSVRAIDCTEMLSDFLSFFEDGHLLALEFPRYSESEKGRLRDRLQVNLPSRENLVAKVKEQQVGSVSPADQIIGMYTDGTAEIAMLKEGQKYVARLLQNVEGGVLTGEVKAELTFDKTHYTGRFYSYSRSMRFTKANLHKAGTLLSIGNSLWLKTDSKSQRVVNMTNRSNINYPTFNRLDEESVLVSIPSFSIEYKLLADLIKANRKEIFAAKNLIFDIRGNRGGNAIYFQLFKFFADRNMEGGQGDVLASEDNLAYFSRNLRYSKEIYQPVVDRIGANMEEIVKGPEYPVRKFKRRVAAKSQHVAILADGGCISAAESFILHAKRASSIVQVFGTPTAGVIDYTSVNSIELDSGNQHIFFGYPTSTLHADIPENGYNKTGILPDVPIDGKVTDKVAFILAYYKADK